MQFIVSEKKSSQGLLLVVTDEDILGTKFEEGRKQLDLSADFYAGERKTKEEVKQLMPKAKHLHLSGKHSVAIALEMDLISSGRILWVNGVPHAEVVSG